MLQRGEEDKQPPHNEDEIYYVISGAARTKVAPPANQPEEDRAIASGDIIFVKAHDEHRFHDVTQELVLPVVFAPAMTMLPLRIAGASSISVGAQITSYDYVGGAAATFSGRWVQLYLPRVLRPPASQ